MANDHNKPDDDRPLRDDERVEALMPWFRRGDLSDADAALISEDERLSPAFHAELEREDDLAAAMRAVVADEIDDAGESAEAADAAWSRFQERLAVPGDAPWSHDGAHQTKTRPRSVTPARTSAWRSIGLPKTRTGWLAGVQTAMLAALAFVFLPGPFSEPEPQYTTLSSGEAPDPEGSGAVPGNAVLMFDPALSEAGMRETLSSVGARIVDGPMANGGYLVALDEETYEASLDALRNQKGVALVEPLNPVEQP